MLASDPPRPLGESEAPTRPLPPTPDEDGTTGTLVNTNKNRVGSRTGRNYSGTNLSFVFFQLVALITAFEMNPIAYTVEELCSEC